MQLQLWPLALLALSSTMQVASSHVVRSTLASAANMTAMDNASATGFNSTKFGLQARGSIPHDVPEFPHCTYKGKDSLIFMVFSKDFGRHDETSTSGCGSDMLHHLRKECSKLIVNWGCAETPQGEHSSFMEFKVPIQTSNGAGKECVEKAFRSASGPQRQQVLSCCPRGNLECRKRNCKEYQKTHPELEC